MSEEVLEGLKGVDHLSSFFDNGLEKNAVWYDPSMITIKEMEKALKDKGVYLGTDTASDKE